MKQVFACVALALLASCGVAGDPIRPDPADSQTSGTIGVSISGTASVGVRGGSAR